MSNCTNSGRLDKPGKIASQQEGSHWLKKLKLSFYRLPTALGSFGMIISSMCDGALGE